MRLSRSVKTLGRAVLPAGVRQALRRAVLPMIPMSRRMGKRYWQTWQFLQDAQWWDRERIEKWQLAKLQAVVRNAYENVPGYNALYREAGVKPDDIRTLSDVRLLPFTTKDLFRDNRQDFQSRAVDAANRQHVTTSGSTGLPFEFYLPDYQEPVEWAFMFSGWQRRGWSLGDTSASMRGAFVGTEDRFWNHDKILRILHLSSYYVVERNYERYMRILEKHRPKHLRAYPSSVMLLADLILEHGDAGRVNFETIFLGSENVYEWQKERLAMAFPGAKLLAWYGNTEHVILAPWCEKADHYHSWPFYSLLELLDTDGREVEDGESGEMVGTSFVNDVMPFIRYRTMDNGRKKGVGCEACGRQFTILETIEGRMQEMIYSKTGRFLSITGAVNAVHENIFSNVREFQFYQDTAGELVLRLVPKQSYTADDDAFLLKELGGRFGEDIDLSIQHVDEIDRTRSGKHKVLIQKLSLNHGE